MPALAPACSAAEAGVGKIVCRWRSPGLESDRRRALVGSRTNATDVMAGFPRVYGFHRPAASRRIS